MFLMGFCCCDPCVIFSDRFEREDSGDIGDSWTEHIGNWSVADGKLTLAAPSDGDVAYVDDDNVLDGLGSSPGHTVKAVVRGTDDGDQLGLLLYLTPDDDDDAVYCVLTIHDTDAVLDLYKRTGGVDTLESTDPVEAPTNTDHDLEICWSNAKNGHATVILNGEVVAGDYLAGVGVGQTDLTSLDVIVGPYAGNITGTPTWDNFELRRAGVDGCDCALCNSQAEYVDEFTTKRSFWSSGGFETIVAGRMRGAPRACFETSLIPPGDFTLTMETQIYWSGTFNALSATSQGLRLRNDFSAGDALFFAARILGNYDIERYLFSSSSTGGTNIAVAPAQGDRLKLVIHGDATDEVDVDCYVNDVLVHSEANVPMALRDFLQFYPELYQAAVNVFDWIGEWEYYYQTIV